MLLPHNWRFAIHSNGVLTNNQLVAVVDPTPVSNYDSDLDGSSSYTSDADGNLITDSGEEIDQIEWNLQGKVGKVTRSSTSTKPDLEFRYDPMGNRRMKIVKPRTGSGLQNEQHWQITHYTRDASGNMLATYTQKHESDHGTGKWYMKLDLDEQNLYGAKRLGTKHQGQLLASTEINIGSYDSEGYLSYQTVQGATTTEAEMGFYQRPITAKAYELSNHLGNVLQTISDRNIAVPSDSSVDYYAADVLSFSDYYPFGMVMEDRNGSNREHHFGFQDQETDNEIWGGSSFFKYRMNDPRIGRFFAVDPLAAKYPHNSVYAFSENKVSAHVELEGLEATWVGRGTEVLHKKRLEWKNARSDLFYYSTWSNNEYRALLQNSISCETCGIYDDGKTQITRESLLNDLDDAVDGVRAFQLARWWIAERNLQKYLSGMGGLDIFGINDLSYYKGAFQYYMEGLSEEVSSTLMKNHGETLNQMKPGDKLGLEIVGSFAAGQNAGETKDGNLNGFSMSFGRHTYYFNGAANAEKLQNGEVHLSGTLNVTMVDVYDFNKEKTHSPIKNAMGIADNHQMRALERHAGASSYPTRAYFYIPINGSAEELNLDMQGARDAWNLHNFQQVLSGSGVDYDGRGR